MQLCGKRHDNNKDREGGKVGSKDKVITILVDCYGPSFLYFYTPTICLYFIFIFI